MRKHFLRNNFVSGQISEALASRTEHPVRYDGLVESTNTVHHPQGGVTRRPGLAPVGYVDEDNHGLASVDYGSGGGRRVFPWYRDDQLSDIVTLESYGHIITEGTVGVRIYPFVRGGEINPSTDGHPDYTGQREVHDYDWFFNLDFSLVARNSRNFHGEVESVIDCINFTQTGDSLILTCPSMYPHIVRRHYNADGSHRYTFDKMIFYNPPMDIYLPDDRVSYRRHCLDIAFQVIQFLKRVFPVDDPHLDNTALWSGDDFVLKLSHFLQDTGSSNEAQTQTFFNGIFLGLIGALIISNQQVNRIEPLGNFPWAHHSTGEGPLFWTKVSDDNIPDFVETLAPNHETFKNTLTELFRWRLTNDTSIVHDDVLINTVDRLGVGDRYCVMKWNPLNGHPACSAIWGERLAFAGTLSEPSTIWFSQVHDYQDFISETPQVDLSSTTEDESLDPDVRSDYGTYRTLDTHHPIHQMFGDTGFVVLASDSEWALQGYVSADDLTTLVANQYGHYGTFPSSGVCSIDGSVYYASQNSAHAMYYDGSFRGYVVSDTNAGRDETLFNSDSKRIIRVCSAQTRNQQGVNQVFFLRADGTIAVLHINFQEEFQAWSVWKFFAVTSSTVPLRLVDICSVGDHLVLMSNRGPYYFNPSLNIDVVVTGGGRPSPVHPIELRMVSPDLSSQYLQTPPEGHVSFKSLEKLHLTFLDSTNTFVKVRSPGVSELKFKVRDRATQNETPSLSGKRVIHVGCSDLEADEDTEDSIRIIIENKDPSPFNLLRMDYKMGYSSNP